MCCMPGPPCSVKNVSTWLGPGKKSVQLKDAKLSSTNSFLQLTNTGIWLQLHVHNTGIIVRGKMPFPNHEGEFFSRKSQANKPIRPFYVSLERSVPRNTLWQLHSDRSIILHLVKRYYNISIKHLKITRMIPLPCLLL